ncbi:MAG: fungal specific transcription factor domain-containing protein, partial [Cytophagaceae bacterium]
YYSASGDKRVISFMEKYFAYQKSALQKANIGHWTEWATSRGHDNAMMAQWLYTINGDASLLDLADLIQKQAFQWTDLLSNREWVIGAATQQNDAHWMNPAGTSVVWLGMCYAMMTLALQSYHRAGDEPPEYRGRALELSHEHRLLTAQCILLADITQPIAQLLETLVLHVQAEYGRSRDAEPSVLLMTGICVRLAIRMGYHRDPGPHANIKPFMGEMRRRVWTFVRQIDLLISFQFGMPSIVRSDHVDTQAPRNLYDDELHEDMKELPASRPAFEATPMTYMIAKSRITFTFGQIVERTGSLTNQPSYEETMSFDQQLRDIRASHPPLLQMRPFQDSARDPANLIMQRIGLELVYLRSIFVLHRRFIAKGRDNPRYAYSRRACI